MLFMQPKYKGLNINSSHMYSEEYNGVVSKAGGRFLV